MTHRPLLTIVLAAGKGTRMKSAAPKVLHRIGGLSMLGHVLAVTRRLEGRAAVVIGPDMEAVRAEALARAPDAEIFIQERQLGTAHAVLAARKAIERHSGDVLVLFADTPLIEEGTLSALRGDLGEATPLAVLGFTAANPAGYGRMLRDANGDVLAIREDKDANGAERQETFCASGVMAFRSAGAMLGILDRIGAGNAQGEFYLTDAVAIARSSGLRVASRSCPEQEVLGINSRSQLAAAEAVFQGRMRERAMAGGASLIAPETVWFSHDTVVGRDVTIEPNVFFGPRVAVEDEVIIHANCHLEGARLRRGVEVGPFARLRPGADLGAGVKIGNFVEVKNVTMEAGAKANHLAYLGDGRVGAGANIGAGTIFCNYDGFFKHSTTIGNGAFIGSNTSLVAPVQVGDGAYIGSGSVITRDVPADSLALERNAQTIKEGWAAKFRAVMKRRKAEKPGSGDKPRNTD